MNQYQQDNFNSFNRGYKCSHTGFKNVMMPLIFFCFTLVFLIVVICATTSTLNNKKLFENEPSLISEISRIDKDRDSNGDYHYTVFVTYEVDGIEYNNEINVYTSDMRVGSAVEIKYLASDPNEIYVVGSENFFNTFLIIIIIANVIPAGIILYFIILNQKIKHLRITGKKKSLTLIGFEINASVSINGRSPYYLLCQDPISEEIYITNKYYLNTSKFPIGNNVNIYIDQEDENYFFIDVNSIVAEKNSNILD